MVRVPQTITRFSHRRAGRFRTRNACCGPRRVRNCVVPGFRRKGRRSARNGRSADSCRGEQVPLAWPAERVLTLVIDRAVFGQETFEKVLAEPALHLITWQKGYAGGGWVGDRSPVRTPGGLPRRPLGLHMGRGLRPHAGQGYDQSLSSIAIRKMYLTTETQGRRGTQKAR